MRIKAFDRFLLILVALILVAIAAVCFCMVANVISVADVGSAIMFMFGNVVNVIISCVIAVVVLIIGFRLLFLRVGRRKEEGEQRYLAGALIKVTDIGILEISYGALDSMVQKHVRSNSRVKDVQSSVRPGKGAVMIALKLALMPDTNIPEITVQIQQSLKLYIEELSGIVVQDIRILVESTSINLKARVD